MAPETTPAPAADTLPELERELPPSNEFSDNENYINDAELAEIHDVDDDGHKESEDTHTELLNPSPSADLASLAPSFTESVETPGGFNSETSSFREMLNVVKGPGNFVAVAEARGEELPPNLGTKEELELIHRVNSGELNIFDAARHNDVEMIRRIVKACPEAVNFKDWGNTTPSHLAGMYRCFEALEELLVLGANAKVRDGLNKLPLDYIQKPATKAYLQRIADKHDPENLYLDDDSTVAGPHNEFRAAAFEGDMKKLDSMLERDPTLLNIGDKKGTTALMFACMNRKFDCAYYLLERGADIKMKTSYGHTADSYILNPVHRNKVLVFAFKMSPQGRAQSAALFAKRKIEEKEARFDCMQSIMEDIRAVVVHREKQIIKKAEILSELAADWATNYFIPEGERLAHADAMHKWQVWQDELAREEQERQVMAEEEKNMKHLLFVWDQVAKRRQEQAERERRIREAEEIARRERDRIERERIQREAREEAERKRAEADLRKAERQALAEWEELEQERRKKSWLDHCENKPHRLKLYQRMRFAVGANCVTTATNKGLFGDSENGTDCGVVTSLREEVHRVVINTGRLAKNADNIDLRILSQHEKDVVQGFKASITPAEDLLPIGHAFMGRFKGPMFRSAGK